MALPVDGWLRKCSRALSTGLPLRCQNETYPALLEGRASCLRWQWHSPWRALRAASAVYITRTGEITIGIGGAVSNKNAKVAIFLDSIATETSLLEYSTREKVLAQIQLG